MGVTPVTNAAEVTTSGTRDRRAGSARLKLAAVLIFAAVVVVAATIPTGSWLIVALGGSVSALLGVIATRITRTEVLMTRREAAKDRANQAKEYRDLSALRSAEHRTTVERLSGEIKSREADIAALQDALVESHRNLAESGSLRVAAEAKAAVLAERVLELEITVEALRAELDAMQAMTGTQHWSKTA